MTSKKTPETLLEWMGINDAPDWRVARPFGPLLTLLVLVLFGFALTAGFSALYRTITGSSDVSLGIGALITAILSAPFLIWNTMIRQQSLEFQKEGHITDRITKAVEQLGTEKTVKVAGKDAYGASNTVEKTVPNIEVRIGGLLSLERIAQDSTRYDQGRDHVRVMEIICAYIRENAPASEAKDYPEPEWEPLKDNATEEEQRAHIAEGENPFGFQNKTRDWAKELEKPRQDIQTALVILGRRTAQQRRVEANWSNIGDVTKGWVFDDEKFQPLPDGRENEPLSKSELDGFMQRLSAWKIAIQAYSGYRLDLRNTNLQSADLTRLVLSGSMFQYARLEGANLSGARLEGAYLNDVNLVGANATLARLEGSNLQNSHLEGVDLYGASLQAGSLKNTGLEEANLFMAKLAGAHLFKARLESAILFYTCLAGADLEEVRLERANLRSARLEAANLSNVRLNGAYHNRATFQGAGLRFVDLSNVDISAEQITSAFGDASVTLPGGDGPDSAERPAHWPKSKLDYGQYETQYNKWQSNPDGYTPPPPPDGN